MGGLGVLVSCSSCFVFAWFCSIRTSKSRQQVAPSSSEHWLARMHLGGSRILWRASFHSGRPDTAVSVAIGIYGRFRVLPEERRRHHDALWTPFWPFPVLVPPLQATLSDWSGRQPSGSSITCRDKAFTARLTNVVPLFFALRVACWLTLRES